MYGNIGTGPVNSYYKGDRCAVGPCTGVSAILSPFLTIHNVCKSTGGRADADDDAKVGPSSYKL